METMGILASDRVYTAEDSLDLIGRCLRGDQAAFTNLYRLYANDIYRLVYGYLGHRQDVEEVVQDTFIYAMRNLARYDPQKAGFRTWLFIIATSRTRNKRRRRWLPTVAWRQLLHNQPEPAAPDEPARPPEAQLEAAGTQAAVQSALAQRSPKQREAAGLRYFDGLTYKEIGQILDIPHKTAESRVRLAHKVLRGLIVQDDGDLT